MRGSRKFTFTSLGPGPRIHLVGESVQRSPAPLWIGLFALIALALTHAPARGETFKCVDAAGKTSYQADPCPAASDATLKVQAPAPPSGSARQASPAVAAPAATGGGVAPSARGSKDRIPSEADFKGPREAWERMGSAIRRGDKEAALKELTPSAQRRLGPLFETIGSKPAPFNADELGSIRSVTLAGEGLATITLTRTKADGTYLYQVNLIRDGEGKWHIDNM